MTEQDWLECTDLPNFMIGCLGDRPSERQLRLLACAMVRQVWHLLTDPRSRAVVEIAERFADGLALRQELNEASLAAEEASALLDRGSPKAATAAYLTGAVENLDGAAFQTYISVNCSVDPKRLKAWYRAQTDLLRDIFRNPFRPLPAVHPSWLSWNDGKVRRIASAAYTERRSESGILDKFLLNVLADGLENAGCTNEEILSHCRSPLDHVRGCWVIDLLLGKEDHTLTKAQWTESTDLEKMFRFLWNHRELSRRKQLLFGVACCRRIWHRITSEQSRWAVQVAEYVADGFAAEADLEEACDAAGAALDTEVAAFAAYYAAGYCPIRCAAFAADPNEYRDDAESSPDPSEQAAQRELLRCMVGNPFRPNTLAGQFLTPSVVAAAQSIYEQEVFDRLPMLADALEEAGCQDHDILAHCRRPGEHVRGCWVLDLLLDKE